MTIAITDSTIREAPFEGPLPLSEIPRPSPRLLEAGADKNGRNRERHTLLGGFETRSLSNHIEVPLVSV